MTEDQTRYVYKKVEQGSDLNTETMNQEIEEEEITEKKPSGENENLYQKVVLDNVYKDENKTVQMENWSILSGNGRCIQHDEGSKTIHDLNVKTLDYQQHKKMYHK